MPEIKIFRTSRPVFRFTLFKHNQFLIKEAIPLRLVCIRRPKVRILLRDGPPPRRFLLPVAYGMLLNIHTS